MQSHPKDQPEAPHNLTAADYLNLENRWEILEGEAIPKNEGQAFRSDPMAMSPAPSPRHQFCSMALSGHIWNYLQNHECQVYTAPLDVYLHEPEPTTNDKATILQPDIVVICDPQNLDDKGYHGVPKWVIEIVSPASKRMDYIKKLYLYEKYGVPEYWIVNPTEQTVMVFQLNQVGQYEKPAIYTEEDQIESPVFPGLAINLAKIFGVNR